MSKIRQSPDIDTLTDDKSKWRYCAMFLKSVYKVINGNIEIGVNVFGTVVEFRFETANQSYNVAHNLGRQVTGYIVIGSSVASSVYDGAGPKTTDNISLRASVAATIKLFIF